VDTDGWVAFGVSSGSGRCDGCCGSICGAEVAVEASLVAWVWFDQRIDQRMMGLLSQLQCLKMLCCAELLQDGLDEACRRTWEAQYSPTRRPGQTRDEHLLRPLP